MNKLYATVFTGLALVLAGTTQAQHPVKGQAPGLRSLNPTHPVTQEDGARGGTPVNDDCTGAVVQNLAAGATVSFSGDNTGATEDGGTGFVMVWEAFTTTECTDVTINYCVPGSEFTNYLINLAVACPDFLTGVLTGASDGCSVTFEELGAGTYYIPVMVDTADTPDGPYTIEAIATACPPPPPIPANDECANAISMGVGTWCNFEYFTGAGATESMPATPCAFAGEDANDDVWFSFVATSTDISIGAIGSDDGDANPNTGYDAVVELFSGTCGSLTSEACADATLGNEAEEVLATGLTVGTTYYVRVHDWYTGYWDLHTFGFCLVEGSGIGIGIEENVGAAGWSIFPNPGELGTRTFTLQFSEVAGAGNVEVFDVTGRAVYSERTSLGATHTLDLNGVAAGNYTVRVTLNDERTEQKLVVQ